MSLGSHERKIFDCQSCPTCLQYSCVLQLHYKRTYVYKLPLRILNFFSQSKTALNPIYRPKVLSTVHGSRMCALSKKEREKTVHLIFFLFFFPLLPPNSGLWGIKMMVCLYCVLAHLLLVLRTKVSTFGQNTDHF